MSGLNDNPIVKRIVYKVDAVLASPALIGSGANENTDSDVLLNAEGNPYLPGSALAGVLRHALPGADALFGSLKNEMMSALWVMDSAFDKSGYDIVELDGVALDPENKTALTKKKYDFQAVPAGAKFTIRLMLLIRKNDVEHGLEALTERLLSKIHCGNISVGAKVNRGFGRITGSASQRRVFDFSGDGRVKALEDWIGFTWSDGDWKHYTPSELDNEYTTITVGLKLDGSIMIRDTRSLDGSEDYKHISQNGVPVIYGTSWAGAIKGGLYKLLLRIKGEQTEEFLNSMFGYVSEDDKTTQPSNIRFDMSELKVEEGLEHEQGFRTLTRVKINRFTGGAADGALFTERPWIGGKTALTIRYPKGDEQCEALLRLALDAIDKGIITIGGETAVGRGVFKVTDNPLSQREEVASA
jgi:hypothetical protein